jgi:hypothetical protein
VRRDNERFDGCIIFYRYSAGCRLPFWHRHSV